MRLFIEREISVFDEYVNIRKALAKEKQFNKKVELNSQIQKFREENNVVEKDNNQSWEGIGSDYIVKDILINDIYEGTIAILPNQNVKVIKRKDTEVEDYRPLEEDINPLDEDADMLEKLLVLVDGTYVVEELNNEINKIAGTENVEYITADWVYDEVRIEEEPISQEEIDTAYDDNGFNYFNKQYVEDIANKDIVYALDEDKIYNKDIVIEGQIFTLMFKIKDYYECILKVWDIE